MELPFPGLVVQAELGRGTHATVLLARRTIDNAALAVKVVPGAAAHGRARARARREARLLARLDHPHVVHLHATAHQHDDLFLLLEYVPGPTLAQLQRGHRFGMADTTAVVAQLGDALQYAHGHGVVHRDVKPSNVLLGPTGAKLSDFGLATLAPGTPGTPMTVLTRPGAPVGTASYMSPEAVEGRRDLDHRADLYSLGVVAYELCTGAPPFPDTLGLLGVLHAHLEEEPPRPSQVAPGLSAAMDEVLLWPLHKDRRHRPPDAAAYVAALRLAVAESWPALAPPNLPALAARHRPPVPAPAPARDPAAPYRPLPPATPHRPPAEQPAAPHGPLQPATPQAPAALGPLGSPPGPAAGPAYAELPQVPPVLPPLRRHRPRLATVAWCTAGLAVGAAVYLLLWAIALH